MKISTVVTIFGFLENHAGSASRYFLISFYFIQLDKLGLNLGKYTHLIYIVRSVLYRTLKRIYLMEI